MTPSRLRECLALLWLSQRGLAAILDRHEGTVRQWARGTVQIPPDVALWISKLADFHKRNPPPVRHKPVQTKEETMHITETAGYIVYQSGYPIFGAGRSKREAIDDARTWLSDAGGDLAEQLDDLPEGGHREISGELYWLPATAALLTRLKEEGGQIAYGTANGVACTPEEEEAE